MRGSALLLAMTMMALPGVAGAQDANPLTASLRGQYAGVARNVTRAAEAVPADVYAFRPVEGVRSFGELFGHVADYLYLTCAAAAGETDPSGDRDFEAIADKAALVEAVAGGAAYCASVWDGATDAWLLESVDSMLGGQAPRVSMLTFNTSHINEHYGNLVTYMRLNGIVPPSSAPQQ